MKKIKHIKPQCYVLLYVALNNKGINEANCKKKQTVLYVEIRVGS